MRMGFGSGMSAAPRSCDSCKSASVAVFCRVDAVALCFSCDTRIHSRASHERVWMCEVCEQAPAAFTCKADAAALCFSCDSAIHSANPLAQRHERVPVQPLSESAEPMVKSSVLSLLVLPDDEDDTAAAADGLFISSKCRHDQDAEAEIDNWLLPYPNTKDNIQAADVGGFFDETDPLLDVGFGDSVDRFPVTLSDALVPDQQKPVQLPAVKQLSENGFDVVDFGRPGNPISSPFSCRGQSPGHKVSSPSFDVGVVPDGGSNMSDISCPPAQTSGDSSLANSALPYQSAPASQLTGADRKARVMRYREKRKNRKFEKTIRYASRKAYAETRPRIKGRFTKRAEVKHEEDCLYSAAHQYGVVPGFLIRPR